jgi:hypothetical protein
MSLMYIHTYTYVCTGNGLWVWAVVVLCIGEKFGIVLQYITVQVKFQYWTKSLLSLAKYNVISFPSALFIQSNTISLHLVNCMPLLPLLHQPKIVCWNHGNTTMETIPNHCWARFKVVHPTHKSKPQQFYNGWSYGIKEYRIEVPSNCITSIPHLVKIYQVVQKISIDPLYQKQAMHLRCFCHTVNN